MFRNVEQAKTLTWHSDGRIMIICFGICLILRNDKWLIQSIPILKMMQEISD